ncbi:MAG TPA: glycosyltransferase, partial [Patescibacteria group bacterium]|nr:glycosyltransferase [Patescibacteria group bacterium]
IMFKIAGKMPQTLKDKSLSLNNVLFVGYVDEKDLCEFYNSLDLFLFPDLKDGWSLPVSEAMTCGIIPVVHKDCCGVFEEIVYPRSKTIHTDEKTCCGIEVDMNNANEIASSILTLFNKPNEMKRLKSLCLKYSKEFDWNKTAKQYYNFIKEQK